MAEKPISISRLTTLKPWPRGALSKAYKRTGKRDDRIEASAAAAQGKPTWLK